MGSLKLCIFSCVHSFCEFTSTCSSLPFFCHSFSILPKALCLLCRAAQAELAWKNKAKHSLDTSFLHTSLLCMSCQAVTVKLAVVLEAGSISLGHSEWMIKMFMRLSFLPIRNLTRSPSSHQCDSHPCSCGYNDAAVEQMFSTSDVPCADVLLVIAWVDQCDFFYFKAVSVTNKMIFKTILDCLTACHEGKE